MKKIFEINTVYNICDIDYQSLKLSESLYIWDIHPDTDDEGMNLNYVFNALDVKDYLYDYIYSDYQLDEEYNEIYFVIHEYNLNENDLGNLIQNATIKIHPIKTNIYACHCADSEKFKIKDITKLMNFS